MNETCIHKTTVSKTSNLAMSRHGLSFGRFRWNRNNALYFTPRACEFTLSVGDDEQVANQPACVYTVSQKSSTPNSWR